MYLVKKSGEENIKRTMLAIRLAVATVFNFSSTFSSGSVISFNLVSIKYVELSAGPIENYY